MKIDDISTMTQAEKADRFEQIYGVCKEFFDWHTGPDYYEDGIRKWDPRVIDETMSISLGDSVWDLINAAMEAYDAQS